MTDKLIYNFGKNVSFTPAMYAEPRNEEEVLRLLEQHGDQSIRVVASRHAWSEGVRTDGLLIDLKHLDQVEIHKESQTVRVGGGCKVKHLLKHLEHNGLTLPSLGLIDEQTVAGATATGTHGSGKHSMSHYIRCVRIAHFDSETGNPTISEIDSGEDLQAARCSLGRLGVILELEFETRPVYRVEEHVLRHDSLENVLAAESDFPLQQFYLMPWSWQFYGQHRVETERPRSHSAGLYRTYWHWGIDWGLHLILFLLVKLVRLRALIKAFYCFVLPLIFVRKWRVVDDSHKMLTMEHELFRHIEIEMFVTRSNVRDALNDVKDAIAVFGGQLPASEFAEAIPSEHRGSYCHHYAICVRRIQADNTLISMASPLAHDSEEDWYAISLISFEWPGRRDGFFEFAKFLASSLESRHNARCHWGKYNPLDRTANERLYPRLKEFRDVVRKFDSHGRFANQWLNDVLLAEPTEQ